MAINTKKVIKQLNRILECELAGVVRYTHYSMMIFGYSRIPIVKWFQDEATESLAHAQQAGEMVTRLGGHPSLAIGDLLETHEHDIGQILLETLEAEHNALEAVHRSAQARRTQVGRARGICARPDRPGGGAHRRDRQDVAQARRDDDQQGSARPRLVAARHGARRAFTTHGLDDRILRCRWQHALEPKTCGRAATRRTATACARARLSRPA